MTITYAGLIHGLALMIVSLFAAQVFLGFVAMLIDLWFPQPPEDYQPCRVTTITTDTACRSKKGRPNRRWSRKKCVLC